MEQFKTQLITQANSLGLSLTDEQSDKLLGFLALLNKWNKAYNLTSVRDPQEMLVRHILDSLVVLPHMDGLKRVIDVGTGPGLPGIPLAIMMPETQFFLLDSLGKRIRFQKQVCHELGLTNVTSIQSRVEKFQPDHPFDAVISRAFASIGDMLSWCSHLGCYFLAMKGTYPEQELAQLPADFTVKAVHPLQVPELDEARHLVEIIRNQ
ncbi:MULTISPECIES: 16S rRNA (guanine(527)-N(7))-methyltransferase RsmG [Corallincola]|uniref:Ribosomal RNA small subunit methyltransferase G n=3 Tax=Corallincola TaxID=1775176 RepID=A0A368N5D5_9GAMM|nr:MULTISPECIES: 16S rRNA (guanine(527)-N(7))-methyltransferase RsmG [Corallincola]RCU45416.1 16S rRNA (guanine(527)-N(7))-methyltransferase RsmG [Corallincola holothuriorum]TAA41074.1 16S rRNA (guanine(527)-N(7))-methyltransferase RsmG [Corallincola spongiicola]TCI02726.1 16S rRNA (guanine(527)-N(7))-methyltransferase RsmG [Corallincola luteus]